MGVTECRVINRSVSVGAPLFFGRIVMLLPKNELKAVRRLVLQWALELFIRTDGDHELLRYIVFVFGTDKDYGLFLERFAPPSTNGNHELFDYVASMLTDADAISPWVVVYALQKYEQALREACANPEKTIVITHEDFSARLLEDSFFGESPQYVQ